MCQVQLPLFVPLSVPGRPGKHAWEAPWLLGQKLSPVSSKSLSISWRGRSGRLTAFLTRTPVSDVAVLPLNSLGD